MLNVRVEVVRATTLILSETDVVIGARAKIFQKGTRTHGNMEPNRNTPWHYNKRNGNASKS